METRASAVYELLDPVPGKRAWWAWAATVIQEMVLGTTLGSVPFVSNVVERRSRTVVYSVKTESDMELLGAQEFIRRDLTSMTVQEFDTNYGIVRR